MKREEKKALQRESIMRAAVHVFARHGYEPAKLDQIAQMAKVGKGTIYNYFPSKYDLYITVLSESLEEMFHIINAPVDPGATPIQEIEDVLHRFFAFFRENPDRYAMFADSLRAIPQHSGRQHTDVLAAKFGILAPKFQEHILRGNLDPTLWGVEDLTLSFLGLAHLFLHRWFCFPEQFDFAAKIPVISRLFLYGSLRHDKK
jgi:AcrR family transcriptional regulator